MVHHDDDELRKSKNLLLGLDGFNDYKLTILLCNIILVRESIMKVLSGHSGSYDVMMYLTSYSSLFVLVSRTCYVLWLRKA